MAGTRKRAIKTEPEEAAGTGWTMQESVDALAGVSASLSTAGDKRKSNPSNGANKRSKKGANGMAARDRSSSIEGLVGAAASLEEGDLPALPAPVDVPNPMLAPPVGEAVAEITTSSPPKTAPAKHHPTGFRKAKSGSSGTGKKGKSKAQPKATAASGLAAAKKTKAAASKNLGLLGADLDEEVPVGLVGGTKITTTTTGGAKRQQVQYNPDVAMTKEQLTHWRREMRRVRNRESAAASRKKVRDRIEELEQEVNKWRVRYGDVINRIGDAERQRMGLPDADQVEAEEHDSAMHYDDEGAAQGDTLHPSAAPAPKQAKAKRKKLPTNKVKKEEGQPMDGDDVLQREGGEAISHQV